MKISFVIEDLDDARTALGQCAALVDAFQLIEDPDCFTKPVEMPVDAPQPVIDEQLELPLDPPAKKRTGRKAKTTAPAEPAITPEEDPVISREKLRTLAVARGVTWLRPILTRFDAARLTDLTDQQVREVLADAA
jgi:hypothetical protein